MVLFIHVCLHIHFVYLLYIYREREIWKWFIFFLPKRWIIQSGLSQMPLVPGDERHVRSVHVRQRRRGVCCFLRRKLFFEKKRLSWRVSLRYKTTRIIRCQVGITSDGLKRWLVLKLIQKRAKGRQTFCKNRDVQIASNRWSFKRLWSFQDEPSLALVVVRAARPGSDWSMKWNQAEFGALHFPFYTNRVRI